MCKVCGIFYLNNGEKLSDTIKLSTSEYSSLKERIEKIFKGEHENCIFFGDFIIDASEIVAVRLSPESSEV